MVNSQLMINWDQQQQYFEQMHLMNAMPSHMSPLSSDNNASNQFYSQLSYQQAHPLMAHNAVLEKDSNDIVLIKVTNMEHDIFLGNQRSKADSKFAILFQLRQPRGRSLDSPDDGDENRLIVTFSQHHNSQGTEAEETLHTAAQAAMASAQYKLGQNVHQIHQVNQHQMQIHNFVESN